MALTYITKIMNKTQSEIVIVVGEKNNESYVLQSLETGDFNIAVPWVGNQEEAWKPIRLSIETNKENVFGTDTIWVFQDYWSDDSYIMYCIGDEFHYKHDTLTREVKGFNKGGGRKILRIMRNENGEYDLRMV
ncbi:hypothetical protein ID850_13550 [Xenorhabdus sp. Flor]|uniref:hypothetical protein n=1 Tax=Xenorhabdus cabanillasii TaxID=351673 RepID=UPI001989424C|nr:hypothetical protein [Xenorhabdus sp. Flor]MBD2815768.1 hypothetical protein [Xenorhabdus sp. Flor]